MIASAFRVEGVIDAPGAAGGEPFQPPGAARVAQGRLQLRSTFVVELVDRFDRATINKTWGEAHFV
jgi:hypothetical protein